MSQTSSSTRHHTDFATLWRLGGLSPLELARRAVSSYHAHRVSALSAQFAYFAILAFAPLLIVLIATVAQLPMRGVLDSFQDAVAAGMPENVTRLLRSQIKDIQSHSNWGLIVAGLFLLAWAGSQIFLTIAAGLDASFGVEQRRKFWKSGGLALALTFGVLALFVIAMVLLVVGPIITEFILARVDAPWVHILLYRGVRWGVACAFLLCATSTTYWLMPTAKVSWHWLSPGSVFATAGWVAVTHGFRLYVENFASYNETYGALGGVVVLMVWLYMTGTLLIVGGLIDGVIHQAATRQNDAQPNGSRSA